MSEQGNSEAPQSVELDILADILRERVSEWVKKPGSSYLGEISGVHVFAPFDSTGKRRVRSKEDREKDRERLMPLNLSKGL